MIFADFLIGFGVGTVFGAIAAVWTLDKIIHM